MPCVTLHCLVHLINPAFQQERFPGIYSIRTSPVGSKEHYSLAAMTLWSTIPYAIWQLSYHFLITVRRREKIAAGRPTSFTVGTLHSHQSLNAKLKISVASKILLQSLDRKSRPLPPRLPPRTSLHANPILLRRPNHGPLPPLVLLPLLERLLPYRCLLLVRLQWGYLLH